MAYKGRKALPSMFWCPMRLDDLSLCTHRVQHLLLHRMAEEYEAEIE